MTAAAMLFIDNHGRAVLVERSYDRELVLPGGIVEPGETPEDAAAREVFEELGARRVAGRLLVHDRRPGKDHYVFEGGLAPSVDDMTPDFAGEIAALNLLAPQDAIARHASAGRDRLAAAFESLKTGVPVRLGEVGQAG